MNSAATKKEILRGNNSTPYTIGEFWTAKQRQASSLHEISYRACFKPQLPRYFIERYSNEGDIVYDPFMGRGTTVIEAALLKRNVIGNNVNPLSRILAEPRLDIPEVGEIEERLAAITFSNKAKANIDLSMFYHPETEAEIVSLQKYLAKQKKERKEDRVDRWIRMVATNRLTGHSSGFFSVYTLPPNQATQPKSQIRINRIRKQTPEDPNIKNIILKKTKNSSRTKSNAVGGPIVDHALSIVRCSMAITCVFPGEPIAGHTSSTTSDRTAKGFDFLMNGLYVSRKVFRFGEGAGASVALERLFVYGPDVPANTIVSVRIKHTNRSAYLSLYCLANCFPQR